MIKCGHFLFLKLLNVYWLCSDGTGNFTYRHLKFYINSCLYYKMSTWEHLFYMDNEIILSEKHVELLEHLDPNKLFLFFTKGSITENFVRLLHCSDKIQNLKMTSDKFWHNVSYYSELSDEFIREFKDEVNWNNIFRRQKLSENIIREFGCKEK